MEYEEIPTNHIKVGDELVFGSDLWIVTGIALNKPAATRYAISLIAKIGRRGSSLNYAFGSKLKRRKVPNVRR